jgi:thioredoxin 1
MRYLAIALLVVAGCQASLSTDKGGGTLSDAGWRANVLDAKQPVLVDFWAPWCGPCRMMDKPLESIGRDFKVYRVNIDDNDALSQRYSINAIPALLIFKDGRVAERFVGVTEEQKLRDALQRAGARPHAHSSTERH